MVMAFLARHSLLVVEVELSLAMVSIMVGRFKDSLVMVSLDKDTLEVFSLDKDSLDKDSLDWPFLDGFFLVKTMVKYMFPLKLLQKMEVRFLVLLVLIIYMRPLLKMLSTEHQTLLKLVISLIVLKLSPII